MARMTDEKGRSLKHNCSEKFLETPSPASAPKRRPGAAKGNRNALKHGRRTREADDFRAELRAHLRETRALLQWCRIICQVRRTGEGMIPPLPSAFAPAAKPACLQAHAFVALPQ